MLLDAADVLSCQAEVLQVGEPDSCQMRVPMRTSGALPLDRGYGRRQSRP